MTWGGDFCGGFCGGFDDGFGCRFDCRLFDGLVHGCVLFRFLHRLFVVEFFGHVFLLEDKGSTGVNEYAVF